MSEVIDTPPNTRKPKPSSWPRYIEAELGFRDHWYPAFFGAELTEADISDHHGDEVSNIRTEVLLGERILFRRVNGKVYAVEDRCRHRGVTLAARPECYTADTITCWYHGFTYNIEDGKLATVITDPQCPHIGRIGLHSYPTEELAGIVWVYIGDDDPPPLAADIQPELLEADLTVAPFGWSKVVNSNWRIAAENAFDPGHAYIHRNSELVIENRVPTVLSNTNIKRGNGMEVVDPEEGPIGVRIERAGGTQVWEAVAAEGVSIGARFRPGDPGAMEGMVPDVSIWLPAGVTVDPFPAPGIMQFEWFIPVDRGRHRYMMTWAKRGLTTEAQRQEFFAELEGSWLNDVPEKFNHDDVFAREAMAEFYDRGEGWANERLYGPDAVITAWRRLVSHRGGKIQTPAHAWADEETA
ncbi:Rieske 2Fe-2S domain-containing protein [Nocardia sp. CA-290969]|uniref:Rieske 2Fe-2S domain-containing protein n=1 Tax=Nocardia sp. CA-290969 TaxID=3239986 RepID=UPI003D8FFCBD